LGIYLKTTCMYRLQIRYGPQRTHIVNTRLCIYCSCAYCMRGGTFLTMGSWTEYRVLSFLITLIGAQIVSKEVIGRRGQTGSVHVGTRCSWVGGGNPIAFHIPCPRIRHELNVKYVVQLLVLLD
jgi:hypothetical protein